MWILLLLLVLWAAPAQAVINDPTGWWRLDETSGNTATDSSTGGLHTGVLQQTGDWRSGATCQIAGCLGTTAAAGDQYMDFGGTLTTFASASTVTIALWFSASGTVVSNPNVYEVPAVVVDASNYIGIFWGNVAGSGNALHVYNWDTDADYCSVAYTAGAKVHIGLVHGGGQLKLYLNGVLQPCADPSSGNTDAAGMTGNLQLFGGSLDNACTTLCMADDLRIYNRALSDAEMAELAAYPAVSVSSPIRRITMEE
jgi:hypothetical protein